MAQHAGADAVHVLIDQVKTVGQATPRAVNAMETIRGTEGDTDCTEAASALSTALADATDQLGEKAEDTDKAAALAPIVATGALALFAPQIVDTALRQHDTLERLLATEGDALAAVCHVTAVAASSPSLRTWLASTRAAQRLLERSPTSEVTADNASTALLRIKLAIRKSDVPGSALDLDVSLQEQLAQGLAAFISGGPVQDANAPSIFTFDAKSAARADALEGLYYLAASDRVKELLSNNTGLLEAAVQILNSNTQQKRLFPARTEGTDHGTSLYSDDALEEKRPAQVSLEFLVVSIIAQIATYPRENTSESQQIEALRQTALRRGTEIPDKKDAAARCRRLLAAHIPAALTDVAVRTRLGESPELRRQLGLVFYSLVSALNPAERGQLLADGITGALLQIIAPAYASLLAGNGTEDDWAPLQGLARLTITSNPTLMYGNDPSSGVPYIAALFLEPSRSAQERFESAMALTNIASVSPEAAHSVAVASFKGVGAASELGTVSGAITSLIMQYDIPIFRCALIELLCNLVQDEGVFYEWSGEAEADSSDRKRAAGEQLDPLPDKDDATIRLHDPRGRLQLLASMCEVDETADMLNVKEARAASGALAMLSAGGAACEHILALPPRCHAIIAQLVWRRVDNDRLDADTAAQLSLRGLSIVSSLVQYIRWLETNKEHRAHVRRRVRDPVAKLRRTGLLQAAAQCAVAGVRAMVARMGNNAGANAEVTSLAVDVMRDAKPLMDES